MKKSHYFLIAALTIVAASCTQPQKETKDQEVDPLAEYLEGTWQSMNMNVNIRNDDKELKRFGATEDTWESTFQMRPIITEFRKDGSFNARFYDLGDSLICTFLGNWEITGKESMVVYQYAPFLDTLSSRIEMIDDKTVKFYSKIAWGKNFGKGLPKDDDYEEVKRRLR